MSTQEIFLAGFLEKLRGRVEATGAVLCIGLDPDWEKLPESVRDGPDPLYEFCRRIVAATAPYACAFKPNLAFFEAYGSRGIAQLEKLRAEIPADIPVILDGKRGDIGNTARLYARFLFEHLNGDAATVNPYMGQDSLEPFFAYPGKTPFVLCLTSNVGSDDLQTLEAREHHIYRHVIELTKRIGKPFGLVVGARQSTLLEDVRRQVPTAPILVPGIGAQGGSLENAITIGGQGGAPIIINVSRDILFASSDEDFAEAAAAKARWYVEQMRPLIRGLA